MSLRRESASIAADVVLLWAAKVALGAWVLHHGFSHVSDDDYARTVISERFAFSPRLDPSATSWLPLPFWFTGTAMMVFGRSLDTARAVALVLGATSVAAPYLAMRAVRTPRAAALLATAIASMLPWSAWLDVATVPDGWTGALIAAGAIAAAAEASQSDRARSGVRLAGAVALLVASLSRYEAWPACAVFALACAWRTLQKTRGQCSAAAGREAACAMVAIAGPALWMAWNAHAHGSALHFVARVEAYRRAIGAADIPLAGKLLGYPRALVSQMPEAVALGLFGAVGLATDSALRRRWGWGAAAAAAVLVFLILGDLADGAPTHHPARALGSIAWLLAGMGADAVWTACAHVRVRVARRVAIGAVAITTLLWCASLPARWADAPGRSEGERRDVQIARGLDLRSRGVPSADVTPCAFEHFALIAAWGRPERARVAPRTGLAPTPLCPQVVER